MNFMIAISLFLLKRQIAFHNFFCYTQCLPTEMWNTIKLNQGIAAEKETYRKVSLLSSRSGNMYKVVEKRGNN